MSVVGLSWLPGGFVWSPLVLAEILRLLEVALADQRLTHSGDRAAYALLMSAWQRPRHFTTARLLHRELSAALHVIRSNDVAALTIIVPSIGILVSG